MSNLFRRSALILCLTAAAMAALLSFFPAAGHDQLWFLLMGRRWLAGATPYGPEIFDSNPPLIIWLSALCVTISALCGVETTLFAKLAVLLLGALIARFCLVLLRRLWRPLTAGEPAALLFGFIVLFFVVPARDLGQRDSLAALLALPYVLASARRSRAQVSLGLTLLAGSLAALAFCLKPQDALLAVAVELRCLLSHNHSRRSARDVLRSTAGRPELLLIVAGAVLYLIAIDRFAPLYFSEALPLLRQTYWAIGGLSLRALLAQALELCTLAALTILLLVRTRPASAPTLACLAAGLGGFLAYLLQGTGWYYQQLPAIDLIGAALLLHLVDLQHRRPLRMPRWIVPTLAALGLLAVTLTAHFGGYPFTRVRAFALTSPDPSFFQSLPPNTSVAILTTSVDEAMMPVEYFHLVWAQRTNNLWLLPAILFSEAPADARHPPAHLSPPRLAALDLLQHRWMAEDLTRWHPDLILVERCQDPAVSCQILEARHNNLLAWFLRDAAFRQIWAHYRLTASKGRFDAYTRLP